MALRAGLLLIGPALASVLACAPAWVRTVTLQQLENAPASDVRPIGRAVLADARGLESSYRPLSDRMGIYEFRTADELARLHALAPHLRLDGGAGLAGGSSRPGLVIALASRIGTPLHEHWPVHVHAVRAVHGGALVEGRFEGGSYLPDGVTFIEAAYVPDATDVLVVEVNGVRFVPE